MLFLFCNPFHQKDDNDYDQQEFSLTVPLENVTHLYGDESDEITDEMSLCYSMDSEDSDEFEAAMDSYRRRVIQSTCYRRKSADYYRRFSKALSTCCSEDELEQKLGRGFDLEMDNYSESDEMDDISSISINESQRVSNKEHHELRTVIKNGEPWAPSNSGVLLISNLRQIMDCAKEGGGVLRNSSRQTSLLFSSSRNVLAEIN